jgi:hypothetical protein
MGLLDPILRRTTVSQEILALKEEMAALAGQLAQLKRHVAKLQSARRENMVVDGPAYYIEKDGDPLDGPFCTSCFDRHHKRVRIIPAAKPKGGTGRQSEWVQCSACQTPFRSQRAAEYLRASRSSARPAREEKPVRKTQSKSKKRRPATTRKAQTPRPGAASARRRNTPSDK